MSAGHADLVALIAFEAGGQYFVLDVMRVRELVRAMPLVPAPGSAPWLLGHMLLRGEVLPVVSLHIALTLGLGAGAALAAGNDSPGRSTRIMVIDTGSHSLALMVDKVSEILQVPADTLRADLAPVGLRSPISFGICVIRDRPHMLLDVRPLLALTHHLAQK